MSESDSRHPSTSQPGYLHPDIRKLQKGFKIPVHEPRTPNLEGQFKVPPQPSKDDQGGTSGSQTA